MTTRHDSILISPPRRHLGLLLSTLLAFLMAGSLLPARARPTELHVATNGNDAWSGTKPSPNRVGTDGPFATLERAKMEARRIMRSGQTTRDGIDVTVHEGLYRLNRPLEFTAEDSGTTASPVAYHAAAGKEVRLIGGAVVSGFERVTDPGVLSRLDGSARDQVWQADLRALGVTNYGAASGGGLDLFFQDRPMPLSRWPNEGFIRISEVLGKTPVDIRGTKGCVEGIFRYEGDRPLRWSGEKDIWLHGYWFWDWSDKRQKVKSVDAVKHIFELEPPYESYGYRKGQWFYAYNLLSEIDRPGEWQLDRETGMLYFWPPGPIESSRAIVSILPKLVTMKDTSYVSLRGFTIEAVRDTAVNLSGGTSNQIVGCTIRNCGSAVSVHGGTGHSVVGCDIYQCSGGGVSIEGGDRKTLTPAGHFAENNHIHHYGLWKPMYSAGINLNGVGNRASHNLIDNAPHQAIGFGGNDHLIEYNEIHSVCFESNDAGAIYAGRDWTMRGTKIRYNYLHDIDGFEGRGCVGVYLDDMYCGTEITGNVFHRVTQAAFIGGGRDCLIANNIFVDCSPAVHVDARALGWARPQTEPWIVEGQTKGTLSGTRYHEPPYSVRYPKLVDILANEPLAPRGNVIARNICVGGKWDDIESQARPLLSFEDNLLHVDPLFVDAAKLNFQLKNDSPAYKLGFVPIPIEKMGLYADKSRASWPVIHAVRPSQRAVTKN